MLDSAGEAADSRQAPAQRRPGCALLFRVVVVHVVASNFTARQHVVLAAVDDVEAHAQLLHHGGAGAAQVVQRALRLMRTARIVA